MAWLAPIHGLGLVILVHEAGHFWAAKYFGVYAPRFAIGFGPTLWRKRWGETEYVLGAIPLGGYVRMATRDDEASNALEGAVDESKGGEADALDPDALIPFGPKPVPPERWFESKPLWQRAVILLAGVTMNVILAVVVAISIFAIYGRGYVSPVVAIVVEGRPAERAGLAVGDSIVAVSGTPVASWIDVVTTIGGAPGRQLEVEVVRAGRRETFALTPDSASEPNPITGEMETVGRVGIGAGDPVRVPVSFSTAVAEGTAATWRMGSSVLIVLKGLFTGSISVSNLGGPVAIARTSVAAARSGFESLLSLIAFLSVNLAILNLVPIPLLDGGQLVMQTAETVKGSPFTDRTREWIARIGLAMIATLFLVVTFNDLKALVLSWIG
jgi:regulator of sigma E protease